MPLKYWDEAFLTATYLINRMPSRVIEGDTPYFGCSKNILTMIFSGPSDAPAGRTYGLTTHTRWNSGPRDASS
jgi:hypothetical protein